MGQCGCGDLIPYESFKIDDSKYLVVEKYPGCQDCFTPIGISLHFFNEQGWHEWVKDHNKPIRENVLFDEYGGDIGSYGLLGANELVQATKELQGNEDDKYFVEEYGYQLLRKGMDLFEQSIKS